MIDDFKTLGKRETQYFDIDMPYYQNIMENLRLVNKSIDYINSYDAVREHKCRIHVQEGVKFYAKQGYRIAWEIKR